MIAHSRVRQVQLDDLSVLFHGDKIINHTFYLTVFFYLVVISNYLLIVK